MRVFLVCLFLLVSIPAGAEQIVCSNNGRLSRYEGDCYKLGICQGFNNSQINQGCIIATPTEYSNAADKYYKYDPSILAGERIVEMTQAEKDALDAAMADSVVTAKRSAEKSYFNREAEVAFIKILINEINTLRAAHGLAPRTIQQLRNAIDAQIDSDIN